MQLEQPSPQKRYATIFSELAARAQLADNLTKLNDVLPKGKKLINDIEATLTEKTKLETDQKTHEENEKFLQIEKEVLASLPEAEQKRITTMRQWLQNNY